MKRTHILGRGGTIRSDLIDVWCLIEKNGSMWVEYRWYRPHAISPPKLGRLSYTVPEFLETPGHDAAKSRLIALLGLRQRIAERIRTSAEIIPFPLNRRERRH